MAATLIDIAVNLTDSSFVDDRADVIDRAREAGVEIMVVTGTTLPSSAEAAALAEEFPQTLYSTAGCHPHHAREWHAGSRADVIALLSKRPVVAVGECGLDFFRNISPPSAQLSCFEAQLEIASDLNAPVFVHERDASTKMYEVLKAYRDALDRVVVHCFTSDRKALFSYLDLDLHIGITGWICDERRGTHLLDLVSNIPGNRLMLETDAPYLLPRTIQPRPKSRRNEPAFLTYVAETVAQARGTSVEVVAEETSQTARDFFSIGQGDGR